MRPSCSLLHPVALARAALVLLALLPLLVAPATPAEARVSQSGRFGSAVPCLNGEDTFATTRFADTIFNPVGAGDPAVIQFSDSGKGTLLPIGARNGPSNATVSGGIGSVYGLAYDDGAVSGVRRIFAAAFTKRMVSFGPGGSGAIYEFNLTTRSWSPSPVAVVSAGNPRPNPNDPKDEQAIGAVGKTGLGDMEISPDGRTLYVMNLAARRIERFDISSGPLQLLPALPIAFDAIPGYGVAMDSDLRPFALEFYPLAPATDPILAVGVTDTAERATWPRPNLWPSIHVLAYRTGSRAWSHIMSESLVTPAIADRLNGGNFGGLWDDPGYTERDLRAWNPWQSRLDRMPSRPNSEGSQTIEYPQPWLTDIEFITTPGPTTAASALDTRILIGLRDRTGDQVFANAAPGNSANDKIAITQGDTLVYRTAGTTWQLITVDRNDRAREGGSGPLVAASDSDYFDDNQHLYDPGASVPGHLENHQGALATALQGGAGGFSERVVSSAQFGAGRSGMSFYDDGAPTRTSLLELIGRTDRAVGKATNLGDIELLCNYALVGGVAWNDIDGDGVRESGEAPFANLGLELIQGVGPSASVLARATTDAQGNYLFAAPPNTAFNIRIAAASRANLQAQGWRVTLPNRGGNDGLDSDMHPGWGLIEFVSTAPGAPASRTGMGIVAPLRESDERTFHIGLSRLAPNGQIGNLVWHDRNNNGLQDSGEPGVSGAQVTLERLPSDAPQLGSYPQTRVTSTSGQYLFDNLEPGIYRVRFGLPAGFAATQRDAGDDARDSDADAGTSYYAVPDTVIVADDINTRVDFGLLGGVDIEVRKSGTAEALVGATIDYSVTVTNRNASVPADGVVLVDDLPPGVTFVSASGGPARAGSRLTWNIGRLNGGESRSFTVRVRAPATIAAPATSQNLTNQASATTTTSETSTANNRASWVTRVVRPEISVQKIAPATVLVGDELSYELRYANTGSVAAANVTVMDNLPAGLSFVRFLQNPGSACAHNSALRQVSCNFSSLAPGASGVVIFSARVDVAVPGNSITNIGTITTATAGDNPADNSSTATTAVQRPNPGVTISISPSPFPVGTGGSIRSTYHNAGSGAARNSVLTISISAGNFSLGALPSGCSYNAAARSLSCPLGTFNPGAGGTVSLPISLPANFSADSLAASASISTATPERPADQADNTANASVAVVRPNVFVDAAGPDRIVGQGSVFWYTLDYGNLYRRNPSLTRAADNVVLRATLPAEVEFIEADVPPSAVSGQSLTWNLGSLAARQTGRIIIVVQTAVPAGATLRLDAEISTSTPGDDPADNRDSVLTDVVQPPADIPPAGGDLRLAIHSELDPNSQDGDPTNGVYLSEGTRIAWPAGEVLDFTPRLRELIIPDEPLPFPYEYRARVVGWSLSGFEVNGVRRDPAEPDSRGVRGCRRGAPPAGSLLAGCAYDYIGGEDREAIGGGAPLREDQLASQAHAYWTQPPAPLMRDDVYLYTVDPLAPVKLSVQVEIEIWVVNAYPGEIHGIPLPEIPVVPLPEPERQVIGQTFEVTLLVPRSVVGPGSVER